MLNQKVYLSSEAYFETYIMDSEINYREYRKRPAINFCFKIFSWFGS